MKPLLIAAQIVLALLLAACATNVSITAPVISNTDFGSQNKTPGRYAVLLQSGGWKSTVEAKGYGSGCTFPTDFDSAYQQAAEAAFRSSFENVTLTPVTMKPAELLAQNYDAQIIIYQGSIKGTFGVIQGFWTSTMESEVNMDGIVAVIGPAGLNSQGTAKGHGTGTNPLGVFEGGCGAITEAIMQAGSLAIKDFVVDAINAAKLNIAELRLKAATAAPAK